MCKRTDLDNFVVVALTKREETLKTILTALLLTLGPIEINFLLIDMCQSMCLGNFVYTCTTNILV